MSSNEVTGKKDSTSWSGVGKVWFSIFAGLGLLAILTRILFLQEKPFHHDESLHAYYSNRVAQGFPHEYSALLHGPVLYYFVGAFVRIFGANDFTVRFPAALCGVVIVMLPLFWRKKIGTWAAVGISTFLLLSPTFMYFGRFLREDSFNALWIVCSLAGFFGYLWTGRAWMAVTCSIFLALQFCNKENSYLHVFIWLLGASVIVLLKKINSKYNDEWHMNLPIPSQSFSERLALWMNCILIYAVIYVMFYSSFFRHSKGAMHGILDGLYRESLLYWWDQNQKRRIDGPFDFHSPLFFNYEFALIPALIAAWFRHVKLASESLVGSTAQFPFWLLKNSRNLIFFAISLLALVLFAPRVGFTGEGCSIAELCLGKVWPGGFSDVMDKLAHLLHITHSRHLLQIIATALLGAIAVLATIRLSRFLDSFLWWWATGVIGVYSYVGEKVPWLLVYILLPLVALAGLEIGRSIQPESIWVDRLFELRASESRQRLTAWEERWSWGVGRAIVGLSAVLLIFSGWKAIRLSFISPADPEERMVFTQSTPMVRSVRERWVELAERLNRTPKITMYGDATWPFAWYVNDFPGHDFTKPATTEAAEVFDAILLDTSELDFARQALPSFDIYKIPLRHWWVPRPNPEFSEILEYFLTSRPYPRELRNTPLELGIGDTSVLYLENRSKGRFFESVQPLAGAELMARAGRSPERGQLMQTEPQAKTEPERKNQ